MKSGTQGCALETCVEVVPLSQAISWGPETHAWPLEALQNAAAVSQISIKEAKGTFTRISIKMARGRLHGFPIKIAEGTNGPVFNQRVRRVSFHGDYVDY